MGIQPTSDYGAESYDGEKHELISQQLLRSKVLSLWINNSLTTDEKRELRYFKTSYTYNNQDSGSTMFFVLVKKFRSYTLIVFSDINTNQEYMRMSHFKLDIPKANLQIL